MNKFNEIYFVISKKNLMSLHFISFKTLFYFEIKFYILNFVSSRFVAQRKYKIRVLKLLKIKNSLINIFTNKIKKN